MSHVKCFLQEEKAELEAKAESEGVEEDVMVSSAKKGLRLFSLAFS